MMKRVVVGAILAAGSSKRLGRPKQLVTLDDETLIARTIRIASPSVSKLAVVVGAVDLDLELSSSNVIRLDNPAFAEGMGSSVRVAAAWATSLGADGLLLLVCDQTRLSHDHVSRLIDAFDDGTHDVGSAYGGSIGVPAIFSARRFAELEQLEGDRGAKSLLCEARGIDWPEGLIDIDSEADLIRERESG